MSNRDGSWLVSLEGYPEVSTDDLTLDELETAEKACGVPYTLMDPHASVRIAKALLGVVLVRANVAGGMAQGAAENDALKRVGKLTTRSLHGAFTYQPPARVQAQLAAAVEGLTDPPSSAATSNAG